VDCVEILGCRIDVVDAKQATERVLEFVRDNTAAQVVTLGTEMVVYAQRDELFRDIVNRCALSVCDTVGLLAVARSQGADLHARVTGVELVEDLCACAAKLGTGIYLFGGAEGVAADAAAILETRFPGLVISGVRNGFYTSEDEAAIDAAIRASGAKILFAGLGSPRQEYWLSQHLTATQCAVGIGVGGSFDVLSGRAKRAPLLWQRLGLEWFYRLISEPSRFRRQLALPYFVWLVFLERIGIGRKKEVSGT
jgi:N-acetylglucosaminyldiphosphoundecaprenol N-acetyl-beta-D-mannosaminyltransferase